jgi:hypothetical protein
VNQLYGMVRDCAASLKARQFPYHVHYGPERAERNGVDSVIVWGRDRLGHEPVTAARGTGPHRRPGPPATAEPKRADRTIAAECRLYIRSSVAGAMVQDHEEECDYLADAVITEIIDWAEANGAGQVTFSECRYLLRDELVTDKGEPDQFPGVVYVIRYSFGRGVFRRNYRRQGASLGLIAGVANTAEVRLKDGDSPEVAP